MRVLMVPHAYLPSTGGVQRMVQQLARSLQADGHQVRILTDVYPSAPSSEVLEGIELERMPFMPGGARNALRFMLSWSEAQERIRNSVREFRPNVVHQHVAWRNSRYAAFAAAEARCPLVVTTHGSFDRDL